MASPSEMALYAAPDSARKMNPPNRVTLTFEPCNSYILAHAEELVPPESLPLGNRKLSQRFCELPSRGRTVARPVARVLPLYSPDRW
jgi:hypothetical protein